MLGQVALIRLTAHSLAPGDAAPPVSLNGATQTGAQTASATGPLHSVRPWSARDGSLIVVVAWFVLQRIWGQTEIRTATAGQLSKACVLTAVSVRRLMK